MNKIHIELQKVTKEKNGRPHKSEFKKWFQAVIDNLEANAGWQKHVPKNEPYEMTVRIIDETEAAKLNASTRDINKATNVLSFPFDSPNYEMDHYLGDIAMCGPVIEAESKQNRLDIKEYWAHMYIHASLHLLGFDHNNDDSALVMEDVENTVMNNLGFYRPYPNE